MRRIDKNVMKRINIIRGIRRRGRDSSKDDHKSLMIRKSQRIKKY